MDNFIEPARTSGAALYNAIKPLGENPPWAVAVIAEKPSRPQDQLRTTARNRQISQSAQVAAVDSGSDNAAERART
jgi:hypothetical protein